MRLHVELALRLLLAALLLRSYAAGLRLLLKPLLLDRRLLEGLDGLRHQPDFVRTVERGHVDVMFAGSEPVHRVRDLAQWARDKPRHPPARKKSHADRQQAADELSSAGEGKRGVPFVPDFVEPGIDLLLRDFAAARKASNAAVARAGSLAGSASWLAAC